MLTLSTTDSALEVRERERERERERVCVCERRWEILLFVKLYSRTWYILNIETFI